MNFTKTRDISTTNLARTARRSSSAGSSDATSKVDKWRGDFSSENFNRSIQS